jgi:putative membrane protein insertion efficiency factor
MRPASHAASVTDEGPGSAGIGVRVALLLLRSYKLALSPLFAGSCRYSPSCSDYMSIAIHEHGLTMGVWLGLKRLARCHPFGGHGFDPVPRRTRP